MERVTRATVPVNLSFEARMSENGAHLNFSRQEYEKIMNRGYQIIRREQPEKIHQFTRAANYYELSLEAANGNLPTAWLNPQNIIRDCSAAQVEGVVLRNDL